MKRIFAASLLTFTALLMSAGAMAQEPVLQAKIPFAFTVGKAHLPAGTYIIHQSQPSVVLFEARGGTGGAFVLTAPGNDSRRSPYRLVFHRYGDQYFLSEIHGSAGEAVQMLYPSKAEKRIQQQEASLQNQMQFELAMK